MRSESRWRWAAGAKARLLWSPTRAEASAGTTTPHFLKPVEHGTTTTHFLKQKERVSCAAKMADADLLANVRLAYQEICKSYQAIIDFRVKLLGFLPLSSG